MFCGFLIRQIIIIIVLAYFHEHVLYLLNLSSIKSRFPASCFPVACSNQGCTNCPKNVRAASNSRFQEDSTKQVQYCRHTDIAHHCKKCSCHANWCPLFDHHLFKVPVQMRLCAAFYKIVGCSA